MLTLAFLLLVLVLCLAAYDSRTRSVPNWVTLPMLFLGFMLRFPGHPLTWLISGLLFFAWYMGIWGGGDAKLWMALNWFVPSEQVEVAALVMGLIFVITASVQLGWRKLNRRPAWGVRSPGVWRAIPFTVWLLATSF